MSVMIVVLEKRLEKLNLEALEDKERLAALQAPDAGIASLRLLLAKIRI